MMSSENVTKTHPLIDKFMASHLQMKFQIQRETSSSQRWALLPLDTPSSFRHQRSML